ncbi:MAG: M48 family metallopeptidase [Bacteroidetes bacterium]|nr:M48 family metallopeptidase [Bacteroidota bacterium]
MNLVADKVLAKDQPLRSKLRIYVLRTAAVNASTTSQGVIFINMGMLAQLENEAQLAYLLCHEITHYKKKHMINRAVERDKIERGQDAYKNLTKDEQLLANRSFSRELEAQADGEGYTLFKQSGYSTAHIAGLFDVLKYASLPFDDVIFDASFLETPSYRIPANFKLPESAQINIADKALDLKSTHPANKERREAILDKVIKDPSESTADYLIGRPQFELARTTARFEMSRIYLLHHQYEDALYNSYLLLKKYPDNLYLKKNVLESLEGLATYAASSSFMSAHTSYASVEGQKQALHYMIGKMDSAAPRDLIILALVYAVRLHDQYPADQDIQEHTHWIMHLLARQEISLNYFAASTAGRDSVGTDTLAADAEKYDKLREQEHQKAERQRTYYTHYALVGYLDEQWLKDMYADAYATRTSDFEPDKASFSRRRKVSYKEYALGAERVLIVDPFYSRVDVSRKHKLTFFKAEPGRQKFKRCMQQCAHAAHLDVEILDAKTLTSLDVDKLNDISLLEEYNSERLLHQDAAGIWPERQRLIQVAQKYNTDYIMWTGVTSLKQFEKRKVVLGCLTGTFPCILPFTITTLINAGQYTLYYNMVYDVKNDVLRMASYREVNARTSNNVLNSHIYDTFSQIHAKPAPKKDEATDAPKAKRK